MRKFVITICTLGLLASSQAFAEKEKDRWDLTHLYADNQQWRAAIDLIESRLSEIQACQGHLGDDAMTFKRCLDTIFEIDKQLSQAQSYASMMSDQDTKVAKAQEMDQKASLVATGFSQKTSFLSPEILKLGEDKILSFMEQDPDLLIYGHFLDDVLRQAPHTLSESEEKIIATAGLVTDTPYNVYSILANADVPWPTVTLSDGSTVRLDQAGYSKHRAAPNRADRKLVFNTFWPMWQNYSRTFGTSLYSQVKRDSFYAKVRNYPNSLASALGANKIPEAVYHTLIEQVNANLDTLHRYFKLRRKMLGIGEMHYYDIYPPLVKSDLSFPIEKGKQLFLDAVKPLGKSYVDVARKGFDNRWMDVYPRAGKRSGAYSNGSAYDVHPYILMNYNEDYDDVSTLAHEWGHTMHSWLANTSQPYVTADYSIFTAEIASTFNEALLLDKMLSEAKNDEERLFYLGSALEQLRGTFYRQAMFAEFELKIHEEVEKGEALSGESMTRIYADILKRYHGHDKGVVVIDEPYTIEWAYIPHFYYNFYVYQYATSLAASSLLADRVMAGEAGALENYLGLLKAGGSDYPYELLLAAGVDLATPAPYQSLVKRMNAIMDEIETILKRQRS